MQGYEFPHHTQILDPFAELTISRGDILSTLTNEKEPQRKTFCFDGESWVEHEMKDKVDG